MTTEPEMISDDYLRVCRLLSPKADDVEANDLSAPVNNLEKARWPDTRC